MAKYTYIDDFLSSMGSDLHDVLNQETYKKMQLSIEEWLDKKAQLDLDLKRQYQQLNEQESLGRLNHKGESIALSSKNAKKLISKRRRAGLRTIDDISEHFKKGYLLLHKIRSIFTQQEITYSILYAGRRKRGVTEVPLFEATLRIEEVLKASYIGYGDIKTINAETELSNAIQLKFSNSSAKKALELSLMDGGEDLSHALVKKELWDSLFMLGQIERPNANRGRLYEVYYILTRTPRYQRINYIGHTPGKANTIDLALSLIDAQMEDTDKGWQKGDFALEQLKAVYRSASQLIDGKATSNALKDLLKILQSTNEQDLIQGLKRLFTIEHQASKELAHDKIEEAMRNEAIENIETVVKNAGLKLDN